MLRITLNALIKILAKENIRYVIEPVGSCNSYRTLIKFSVFNGEYPKLGEIWSDDKDIKSMAIEYNRSKSKTLLIYDQNNFCITSYHNEIKKLILSKINNGK